MAQYTNTYTVNPFIRIAQLETENMRLNQRLKDIAKDLLIEFNEWINEHYDAKYNAYCVCIPIDKVGEFLTHKAKEYGVE